MTSFESIVTLILSLLGLYFLLRMLRENAQDIWQGLICALVVAVMVVVCTLLPQQVRLLLTEFPFVSLNTAKITFFDFSVASAQAIYVQLLSMLLLTFLTQLTLDDSRNRDHFLRRILSLCAVLVAHWLICRFLIPLVMGLLSPEIAQKLPGILIIGLGIAFLLSFLKLLVGLSLTILNPILGVLFGFFFGHRLGKNLSRAIIATAFLALLVICLRHMGHTSLPISPIRIP